MLMTLFFPEKLRSTKEINSSRLKRKHLRSFHNSNSAAPSQQLAELKSTQQKAANAADLKQTGSQLLQLLLQLIPDLRQTFALLVF